MQYRSALSMNSWLIPFGLPCFVMFSDFGFVFWRQVLLFTDVSDYFLPYDVAFSHAFAFVIVGVFFVAFAVWYSSFNYVRHCSDKQLGLWA